MKDDREKLVEKLIEFAEDIKNIAQVRKLLSESSILHCSNPRNVQRLIDACDKIQFDLELSIERYCKD